MKVQVEMLAFNQEPGVFREVEIPDEGLAGDALLESVFRYGQNEFQPRETYSVSVGDVIHLEGKKHLVRGTGFAVLSEEDYEGYVKLPVRDRQFFAYGFGDRK